jgi:hypothetical protein
MTNNSGKDSANKSSLRGTGSPNKTQRKLLNGRPPPSHRDQTYNPKERNPPNQTRQMRDHPDYSSDRTNSNTTEYFLERDQEEDYSESQSPQVLPIGARGRPTYQGNKAQQGANKQHRHDPHPKQRLDARQIPSERPQNKLPPKLARDEREEILDVTPTNQPEEDHYEGRHTKGRQSEEKRPPLHELQITERKISGQNLNSQQSVIPLDAFNEMVAAYQSKIKVLETTLAKTETELKKEKQTKAAAGSIPSEQVKGLLQHLMDVEGSLEECSEFIEEMAKNQYPNRRGYPGEDPKRATQVFQADELVHLIRKILQENECFIVDLQEGRKMEDIGIQSEYFGSTKRPDVSTLKDTIPTVSRAAENQELQNQIRDNLTNDWLKAFNKVLKEPAESSMEGVIERVTKLVSDCLSFQLISSTYGEKQKSMQRQIDLSNAEFTRVSEERTKLEGLVREQLAEINKLKIELSNDTSERRGSISDSAKELQKDQEISNLRRELQEKNLYITKLEDDIVKMKKDIAEASNLEKQSNENSKKQLTVDMAEVEKVFQYIEGILVQGTGHDNPELERTKISLQKGPFNNHISMIKRLIDIQSSKQESLTETYKEKFYQDNLLLQEIKAKLIHYEKILEVLDSWPNNRSEQGSAFKDLKDLAPKTQRQAIRSLVDEVEIIIEQNNRVLSDTISGDIDTFIHRPDEEDGYLPPDNHEEEISFARSPKEPRGPQSEADQSREMVPYSPNLLPRRTVEPSGRGMGDVRRRSRSSRDNSPTNINDLGQLLIAQTSAIEKY